MKARQALQEFDEAPMATSSPGDEPGPQQQDIQPDSLKSVLDELRVPVRKAGNRSWVVGGNLLLRQNARQLFIHDRATGFRYRMEFGYGFPAFKQAVEVVLRGFGKLS